MAETPKPSAINKNPISAIDISLVKKTLPKKYPGRNNNRGRANERITERVALPSGISISTLSPFFNGMDEGFSTVKVVSLFLQNISLLQPLQAWLSQPTFIPSFVFSNTVTLFSIYASCGFFTSTFSSTISILTAFLVFSSIETTTP